MGWSDDDDDDDDNGSWGNNSGSGSKTPSDGSDAGTDQENEAFSGSEMLCDNYDSIKVEHEDPDADAIPEVIEEYQTRVIDKEKSELETNPDTYIDGDEDFQKPYGFKAYKQIIKLTYKLGKLAEPSAQAEISQKLLTSFQGMMQGIYSNGDHYRKMCIVPLQKLIERGIFGDIVSPASSWKQPPHIVADMFACLLDTTEKCNWRAHAVKVKLSMLEFYLDTEKYDLMPVMIADVEAFCQLSRDQGGAAENVRKNSLMTLKSIQMEYHYAAPEGLVNTGLLDRWDLIEVYYNECKDVMTGEHAIVVSDKITEGRIHEYGGMVHMLNANYGEAFSAFQDAFKAGGGNGNEERRLNYMLLAWMHKTAIQNQTEAKRKLVSAGLTEANADVGSKIDPFADPDVKNFSTSPLVAPMKALYITFDSGDISQFNNALSQHRPSFEKHHFIGLFCESLEKFARTQAVLAILETYTAVKLSYLSAQVGYSVQQTEDLVVALILDKLIRGSIDQETATLNVHKPTAKQVLSDMKFEAMLDMAEALNAQALSIDKASSESAFHRGKIPEF